MAAALTSAASRSVGPRCGRRGGADGLAGCGARSRRGRHRPWPGLGRYAAVGRLVEEVVARCLRRRARWQNTAGWRRLVLGIARNQRFGDFLGPAGLDQVALVVDVI